jgi:hypothetical protein
VVAAFVLIVNITPSWGQIPNPTQSDGNNNTAGGSGALFSVVTAGSPQGFDNTAFGFDALTSNTTASNNTAIGAGALFSNDTGSSNTATGSSALTSNTTGTNNTASGFFALQNNTAGLENTAIGAKALKKSTGTKNIGIGYQAGVTLTSGNNNIYIGNQGASVESETIRIGTAQAATFIAGINTAGMSGTAVVVDANGQLGVTLSSARYKQDIETMASRSENLLKLRPVTFSYKNDAAAAPHYGLIAEEVATVYPELVTRTATGEVQTVKYHELIPMLLNELQHEHQALQHEHQAFEQQRVEMATLRQDLAELATIRKELADLRSLVGSRLDK